MPGIVEGAGYTPEGVTATIYAIGMDGLSPIGRCARG